MRNNCDLLGVAGNRLELPRPFARILAPSTPGQERHSKDMRTAAFAIAGALAMATAASAQSSRFNVSSTIFVEGDEFAGVSNSGNTLGELGADVDGGSFGFAQTDIMSSAAMLSISGSIGMLNGAEGNSLGSGSYAIDGTQPILVDWNWSSVSGLGGWQIKNSLGTVVASLTFSNGAYTSLGGSFGTVPAGNASVNLGAGTYTFESLFINAGTATSNVVFTFGAIPAPGAIAMLGMAGAFAGGRRRR